MDTKTTVSALHRERMLAAAERVFAEKGFEQTTVDDLSRATGYSRRTLYAYFESKEGVLHALLAQGLEALAAEMEEAFTAETAFLKRFDAMAEAIRRYTLRCAYAAEVIEGARTDGAGRGTEGEKRIFTAGKRVNGLLCRVVEDGKAEGKVREDVRPLPAVCVLWEGLLGVVRLTAAKGAYLTRAFSMTEEDFWRYGKAQLLRGILKEEKR